MAATMKIAAAVVVSIVIGVASLVLGSFVAYRVVAIDAAASVAARTVLDVAESWADFISIERVGSSGCRTYDIETKAYIGPWSASSDGRCHLRDLIRARIIVRMNELSSAGR